MARDEILVFCDSGSTRHGAKHQTPAVQGFVYSESRSDQLGMGWTDHNRSKRLTETQAHVGAARALVGNERLSREKHRGMMHRESWTLECKKCETQVRIRSEKLYPALTRMRELGIARIGLLEIQKGLEDTGAESRP